MRDDRYGKSQQRDADETVAFRTGDKIRFSWEKRSGKADRRSGWRIERSASAPSAVGKIICEEISGNAECGVRRWQGERNVPVLWEH